MFFKKKIRPKKQREPAFRILAANLAKEVMAEKLDYGEYENMMGLDFTGDDDVDYLMSLIEHLPVGKRYEEVKIEINTIIERLLNS